MKSYDANASYATRKGNVKRDLQIEHRARCFQGVVIDNPVGLGSNDFIIRFPSRNQAWAFRRSADKFGLIDACEVVPSDKNPCIG